MGKSGHLTDLADAVRASGLKVVETDGWKTRGHGSFKNVETVVCHHTAGPSTGVMPSLRVVTHGRAGLAGPLCNLGLGRDGTVYVVASGIAFHAGVVSKIAYDNWHAIGIEAEATGTGKWPPVQMDAYARLCAALCQHYGISEARVLGHKEVASPHGRKIDPNFDMDDFRARVSKVQLPGEEPPMNHVQAYRAAIEQAEKDHGRLIPKDREQAQNMRANVIAALKNGPTK
jgi:hypothetical protein